MYKNTPGLGALPGRRRLPAPGLFPQPGGTFCSAFVRQHIGFIFNALSVRFRVLTPTPGLRGRREAAASSAGPAATDCSPRAPRIYHHNSLRDGSRTRSRRTKAQQRLGQRRRSQSCWFFAEQVRARIRHCLPLTKMKISMRQTEPQKARLGISF